MTEDGKRVEVRMGTFACTIEGYDDPIIKLREVMTLVQQMVTETPALVDLSVDVDNAEVQKALDAQSGPVVVRKPDSEETSEEAETGAAADETPDEADGGDAAAEAVENVADAATAEAMVEPDDAGEAAVDAAETDEEVEDAEIVGAAPVVEILGSGEAATEDGRTDYAEASVLDTDETEAEAGVSATGVTVDAEPVTDEEDQTGDTGEDTASMGAAERLTPDDANRTGQRLYGLGRFAAGVDASRHRRSADAPPAATPVPEAEETEDAPGSAEAPDAAATETPDAAPAAASGEASTLDAMAEPGADDDDIPGMPQDDQAAAGRRAELAGAMLYLRKNREAAEGAEATTDDTAPEGPVADDRDGAAEARPLRPGQPWKVSRDTDASLDDAGTGETPAAAASFRNLFASRIEQAKDDDAAPASIFGNDPEPAAEAPDIQLVRPPEVHETPLKSFGSAPAPEAETPEEDLPLRRKKPSLLRSEPEPTNIFAMEPSATEDRSEPEGRTAEAADDADVLNIFAAEPSAPPQDDDRNDSEAATGPGQSDSRFNTLLQRLKSGEAAEAAEEAGSESPLEPKGATADPRAANFDAAAFAKMAGAESVPDLMVASAAWLTMSRGKDRFSRREVMDIFDTLPGDHPKSLEARIKGYGKVVRSGDLELVGEGKFALAPSKRDWFSGLLP